ncbi:glutamate receptor 1-like protein [Euroglyphus maynei]|uniref:Glutamate receptor 1-like protein n=1 Tax=Euroglyphus maynei TaxID=6958 RepID=A0A1Y3BGZ6_EURMA|nr:glutamate receptor 1-like protein [Euroglyphus maynei]
MTDQSFQYLFRFILAILIIGPLYSSFGSAKILAGVTIESAPFINVDNNKFTGFCVDLMNLIEEFTGLNYSLYIVSDGTYGFGNEHTGKVSGLIGDVYLKKADFAIADMTVTEKRKQFVNFTEPFLRFSFSALARRSLVKNLQTMDDLAVKSDLSIGTFMNGKTMINMQLVRDKIRNVQWLYDQLLKNRSKNLVTKLDDAMYKIYHEHYAFIQEEPKNLYLASKDCQLKMLYDQNLYVPGEYAIAFRHDSPHIQTFNNAIRFIKYKGYLKRLIRKHFYNPQCMNGASNHQQQNYLFQLLIVSISLSLSLYWTTIR